MASRKPSEYGAMYEARKADKIKYSHEDVAYVANASQGIDREDDDDHCAVCEHFISPDACQNVRSPISPNGWCVRFEEKGETEEKPHFGIETSEKDAEPL